MNGLNSKSGFTLLEILIVVTLIAILSLSINEFLIKGIISTDKQNARSNLTMETLEFSKLIESDFDISTNVRVFKEDIIGGLEQNLDLSSMQEQVGGALTGNTGNILVFTIDNKDYIYKVVNDNGKYLFIRFENNSSKRISELPKVEISENFILNNIGDKLFEITLNRKVDETNIELVSYDIYLNLRDKRLEEPIQIERKFIKYKVT